MKSEKCFISNAKKSSMSDAIRVLIADAHTLTQLGVESLLDERERIEMVGSAETLEEAQQQCSLYQPDVLVMGLTLPDQDLAQTIAFIKGSCPDTEVLMLTGDDEPATIQALLDAGAKGYLLKDKSSTEIVTAIRKVAVGKRHLGEDALQAVIQARQNDDTAALLSTLTEREYDILVRIGYGDSNREIADRLSLSSSTVSTHITSINEKLGIGKRSKLIAWLWQIGFVTKTSASPK